MSKSNCNAHFFYVYTKLVPSEYPAFRNEHNRPCNSPAMVFTEVD